MSSTKRRTFVIACIALAGIFLPLHLVVSAQDSPKKPFRIGLLTLSQVVAEQENTARVVTDPENYQNIPGLKVMTVDVPATTLEGLVVETSDGKKHRADKAIVWIPQAGVHGINIFLSGSDHPVATGAIDSIKEAELSSAEFVTEECCSMPPIAPEGGVEVVHGTASGNASEMSVNVDGQPADILAARPGVLIWKLSPATTVGSHDVTLVPGPGRRPVKVSLSVYGMKMTVDQSHLLRGQSTRLHVTIFGLENLPASAWESAMPDPELVNIAHLEQVAGLPVSKLSEPTIFLVLESDSKTIRIGKKNCVVLSLHRQDFAKGPYQHEVKVESRERGPFAIRGHFAAYLKNVAYQPL